jgi:hypothetical protein
MKKSYIITALLMGLTATATLSCSNDYEKADYDKVLGNVTLPTVTTDDVQVYGVAAKATLTVTAPEGVEVEEAGFVVSTTPDAALADAGNQIIKVSDLEDGVAKTTSFSGLTAGQTYYVKAFAYVEGGIAYGETKTVTASNDYAYAPFYSTDFTDMTAADADAFTTFSVGTGDEFTPVSLAIVGMRQWAFSSSVLSPNLFSTGSASLSSTDIQNVLTYKADLTGKGFPTVTVGAINTACLFGDSYASQPGDFSILISKTPIESTADLATATVLKEVKFSTDPDAADFEEVSATADIPIDYDGECYISIYNHSVWGGNLGVLITEFTLSSLERITE